MKKNGPDYWIERLGLTQHPEGGFFRETYRAAGKIPAASLPSAFDGDRNFCTSIYFLLRSEDRSVFHRIRSDELWHFYAGTVLQLFIINAGQLRVHRLGNNPGNDEHFQVVIPAGCWFAAKVIDAGSYTLAGCTVAPGFDFADFEIAERKMMMEQFPGFTEVIEMLT